MNPKTDRTEEYGRLDLNEDAVCYSRREETVWTLPLQRLRVVGEYTTDAFPWFDDYFIVFVATSPFETFVAPVDAEGTLLAELSGRLGIDLRHGLANRTDFASRVLWPEELRDHPLFDFQRSSRGQGVWSRVKDSVLPLIDAEPTEEVRRYLGA